MTKTYQRKHWLLFILLMMAPIFQITLQAQVRVQVRVTNVSVNNNVDCDPDVFFITNNSDFVVEYIATDNTLGFSNNNPTLFGLLGDFNFYNVNGNNGPWSNNPNDLFFDHEYVCPGDVPSSINISWQGYENDDAFFNYDLTGAFSQVRTGGQSGSINISGGVGTYTQSFSASGSSGCGTQNYNITFEVVVTSIPFFPVPDNVCTAQLLTFGGTTQYSWCANQTLEPGEPVIQNVGNHGSAWFYFTAPASGQVRIETDLGGTDFGTEIVLYHAADGAGCIHGNNNWVAFPGVNPVKDKFDYLSYQGYSDDDVVIINPNAKATAHFCDIATATANFTVRDGHSLLAGETYYFQVTSDQNNQRGYLSIRLDDLGGSPFEAHDIPCNGIDVTTDALSTTVRTEANGQPFSTQLFRGTFFGGASVSDEEIGSPYNGTNADQFHAYDYVPTLPNGLDGSMWVQFTAATSGRIYFEADIDNALLNESENNALYAPDPQFAPGTPSDLYCSNLVQIADAEGGIGGILGGTKTAVILERCLEPGYTYYGMVDPSGATTADEAEVWVYDPSASDPSQNPPPNDILCLSLADTLFEVPVKPASQPIPFQAVAGNNTNACIESLAGEPFSAALAADRADQTVWHFFTVPPSGVVEMKIRAYIGLDGLNYAIYPLFQDSLCYGGLLPATYTLDGTQATDRITPIASGTTDFAGDIVGLCCLTPGAKYAIQLDGSHPGDIGQYIIEYINEVEVYAGDAQYYTNILDTFNYTSDTSFVCYGDTLFPSIMNDLLGNSTAVYPNCIDIGFMVHDSLNIPDSIINGNFTFIDTVYQQAQYWVNDGTQAFTDNQTHYVSPLADEISTWGELTCPSASSENGVPFVFLREIIIAATYNSANCIIDFSATGGLPAYNGSLFDFTVINNAGDTVMAGTSANGALNQYALSQVDTFTITFTDGTGCGNSVVIQGTPCNDPCINNPVFITPDPIDSTVYTCYPGGDSAMVTIFYNGGEPTITTSDYQSTISGSSAPSANGTYNTQGVGGANPTSFSFTVMDGDNWQVIVQDINGCADTASGLFLYNLTNCSDYCLLNPVASTFNYNCNVNGTALVEISVGGGSPAIDGSDYTIDVTGSSIIGQNYQNVQLPGVVGGLANFSFVVGSGDTWQFVVTDQYGCTDTLIDEFVFDTAHCPICDLLPVQILPDPVDSTVYTCFPNGSAVVTLFLTGGDPFLNGGTFDVITSGSTVGGQNGTTQHGFGIYQFTVNDLDTWQVIAVDVNGCADTATGQFIYNLSNCSDICQQQPLYVGPYNYICNGDGSATVEVSISGGAGGYNGSNYIIDVTGSSNGGNVTGALLAGVIGDTAVYSFTVDDGDNWFINVTDAFGCNDDLGATFVFDINNCPNLCDLVDLGLLVQPYTCYTDKTADVTINISGGQPSFDGSNYLITVIGSSTGSSGYQMQVPGTIGDTTDYTFNVGDGDNWIVIVSDGNCTDSVSGQFIWNAQNCSGLCNDPNYNSVQINGGTGIYSYDCDSLGNGHLQLTITGGLPEVTAGNDDYLAEVNINGGQATYLVNSNGIEGILDVYLMDGDNWNILVYDALRCDTATLSGTFVSVRAVATTNATNQLLIGQFADLDGSNSTGNIISYQWTPPDDVTDPTSAVTTVQPLQETVYTLTVADSLGCVDSASVLVPVGVCVPSNAAFTPNGDGTNDFWEIPCLSLFPNRVQVFNRWGVRVFEAVNYDGTWDGTSYNQDIPDATYYYIIEVDFPNYSGPAIFKGTVTIIR